MILALQENNFKSEACILQKKHLRYGTLMKYGTYKITHVTNKSCTLTSTHSRYILLLFMTVDSANAAAFELSIDHLEDKLPARRRSTSESDKDSFEKHHKKETLPETPVARRALQSKRLEIGKQYAPNISRSSASLSLHST